MDSGKYKLSSPMSNATTRSLAEVRFLRQPWRGVKVQKQFGLLTEADQCRDGGLLLSARNSSPQPCDAS